MTEQTGGARSAGNQRDGKVGRGYRAVNSGLKRTLDITLATVILVILSPILIAVAAAIRLTSRGPAIFRQERVGHLGQPFEAYKFRTMVVDNDDSAHRELCIAQLLDEEPQAGTTDGTFKLEDDPRITGVGRWLRRLSIDEVPQLGNVIQGTMSIVGPRPALDWEAELYRPEHRRRLEVRPGITGLWQVSGRNRLNMIQMLDLDVRYVDEWSVGLDLRIIARTPFAMIRGDGAR